MLLCLDLGLLVLDHDLLVVSHGLVLDVLDLQTTHSLVQLLLFLPQLRSYLTQSLELVRIA